jgi:hypothetical protein
MIAAATLTGFHWPMIVGLAGFFTGFVIQFRLKHHIDREKVLAIQDMAELYPSGIPPRKILTERGRRLYVWFYVGLAIFGAGIIASGIFYSK